MVFCTDFLDGWWSWEPLRRSCVRCGWCTAPSAPYTRPRVARQHPHRTHDLHSSSQDHHPSKNSVQKTIRCNSTSNAPDDGRMYPETCGAKNTLIKLPCCIKLAFQIISWGRCTVKQPSRTEICYSFPESLHSYARMTTQHWPWLLSAYVVSNLVLK